MSHISLLWSLVRLPRPQSINISSLAGLLLPPFCAKLGPVLPLLSEGRPCHIIEVKEAMLPAAFQIFGGLGSGVHSQAT